MNWRRGLLRVWIVASAGWIAGYCYWLWSNGLVRPAPVQNESAMARLAQQGQSPPTAFFIHTQPWASNGWTALRSFAALDFLGLIVGLAGPPLLVLLIAWCIRWAALGFKR